jgi:hypothetical protein
VELDRPGDALDGQVADDLEAVAVGLDAGGGEADLRVLLGGEEVVGEEVLVALLGARVDAWDIDGALGR